MKDFELYTQGSRVNILDIDDRAILATGTVISQGSNHARITTDAGASYDIPYDMLSPLKTCQASAEVIKEEERDGHKFTLVKEESNKDGELTMQFKVLVDGASEPISVSEELVTNVYDQENGWSAPDGFDENKAELIKSTYESGFDVIVDSYNNIAKQITDTKAVEEQAEQPAEPQGEPAFAPGAEPAPTPVDMGGGEGADMGEGVIDEGAEVAPEGDLAGGPEAQAAPAGETGEVAAASLHRPSFSRSILSGKVQASELLNNPAHRLNPILRKELDRRGVDGAELNDLELAALLKDFDWGN